MLDVVGYTAKEVKNSLYYDRYGERGFDNHISIIDPSCGCGTFLYSAVDRIIAGTGYGSEKASRRLEHLISHTALEFYYHCFICVHARFSRFVRCSSS